VASGGTKNWLIEISSNPTIEISRGMRKPDSTNFLLPKLVFHHRRDLAEKRRPGRMVVETMARGLGQVEWIFIVSGDSRIKGAPCTIMQERYICITGYQPTASYFETIS
jgi:hypothetical protein